MIDKNDSGVFIIDLTDFAAGLHEVIVNVSNDSSSDSQIIKLFVHDSYPANEIAVIDGFESGTGAKVDLTLILKYADGTNIDESDANSFNVTLNVGADTLDEPIFETGSDGRLRAKFNYNFKNYGIYMLQGKVARQNVTGADDTIIEYYTGYKRDMEISLSAYLASDEENENEIFTAQAKSSIKIKANASMTIQTPTGELSYAFYREGASGYVLIRDYTPKSSGGDILTWTPSIKGTYKIICRVKGADSGSYEKESQATYIITPITGTNLTGEVSLTAIDCATKQEAVAYLPGNAYMLSASYSGGSEKVLICLLSITQTLSCNI